MMKTTRILALAAAAAALLAGCRRPAGELLTINLPELAGAELQTAWTLDGAARVEECFELAPDRPLDFVWMAGFDGKRLLFNAGDSIFLAGPGGKILSAFSRKGNGPQEYLRINSPFFDPEGRVLVLDRMTRKALTYRPDGTFVSAETEIDYMDVHFFPDGSRVVLAWPDFTKESSRTFSVLGPDGTVRSSGPEKSTRELMMSIQPGRMIAAADGSCWFRYAELDTLYHIRPEGTRAVLALVRPSKSEGSVQYNADGSVLLQQDRSRFFDRSCEVLGNLMFYRFIDTERREDHYLVYDLRSGAILYHGEEAPLLHLDGWGVHAWPSYVHGRDAWCQLTREDAEALLPGYNDDSNSAYLHIVSRSDS
jgi:hypothetical protein